LSAHIDQSEKLQRHNLFQFFFIIKDCRVRTIIDGGSCNNLVSANFVTKIGLKTCAHTHPYYIQWLNNSGKAKVTHTARVHFSIGTYHDYVDCDVISMQACSLLLDHPWEFHTDVVHHGRSNKYSLMHKEKKITLLPLTPNKIVQCDRVITETAKRECEIQHDQIAPPSSSNAIKLKSHAMLATRSDLYVPTTVDAPFHALVCRQVLFSLDDTTTPLPRAITNILQEFKDIFPIKIPDERLVLDLLRGKCRSIGGDLDVGEEGSEQTIVTLQSLHDGSDGYQHACIRVGLTKKAYPCKCN
jgi:hypothetical protein